MTRLRERFEAGYEVDPTTGCWLWARALRGSGYGDIWGDGKSRLAHRVGYELHVGPIPDGLELDHLCRTPACVNPRHLEPVTHRDNLRRGPGRKTHCIRGHEFSFANTYLRPDTGGRQCRACHEERRVRV